jgi:hypothetical protein
MAQKAIGPTFPADLEAAGLLGLAFAWSPDGTMAFDPSMTPAQVAAVEAVYAAHDPTAVDAALPAASATTP